MALCRAAIGNDAGCVYCSVALLPSVFISADFLRVQPSLEPLTSFRSRTMLVNFEQRRIAPEHTIRENALQLRHKELP